MGDDTGWALLKTRVDAEVWRNVVLECPDTGLAIIDPDGRFLCVNPAGARLLAGTGPEAVRGRTLQELHGDAIAQERLSIIRRVLAGRGPVLVQSVWRGVACRDLWVALRQRDDEPPGVLVIVRATAHARAPETARAGRHEVHTAESVDWGPLGVLSRRERDILALIGAGMTAEQIGARLGRSIKTIDAHRNALGRKLHARNRVDLARIAIRAGLAPLG